MKQDVEISQGGYLIAHSHSSSALSERASVQVICRCSSNAGNDVSLETLLERYQQADGHATTELIHRLNCGLLRFFLAQQTTAMEAEDLLQNTWLRIHKARNTYRAGAPVLPWVFGIARHERVDGYRKRRRIQQYEFATEYLPERPVFQDARRAETPSFESLIANLAASEREVLTMLKVDGLTLNEVARATASTVGAVKQKAHRAYAKLRKSVSHPDLSPVVTADSVASRMQTPQIHSDALIRNNPGPAAAHDFRG